MWCALLVTLSGWMPALSQGGTGQSEDERALQVFAALPRAEQQEVVDWMSSTITGLKTFRVNLAQRVLASSAIDEKSCKPASEAQWFDPKVHAPAQPIARRLVPSGDQRNVRQRARLVKQTGRTWEPAWTYHWPTGTPVPSTAASSSEAKAPARVFANALKGRAPREDWVESLVSGLLDDGSQRTTLAAFAHLYTDRNGLAWEGITLHDAWKSGADIEMPDVDVLGIVHMVRDDWTTWTAPVPSSQHERLYTLVGDWFRAANRHRVLRTVCAQAYLDASEPLPDGYAHLAVNMHVLWEEHASDPAQLAAALPKPEEMDAWLESLTQRVRDDPKVWERGTIRMDALKKDAAEVRAVALWVLKEYGAYDRAGK